MYLKKIKKRTQSKEFDERTGTFSSARVVLKFKKEVILWRETPYPKDKRALNCLRHVL